MPPLSRSTLGRMLDDLGLTLLDVVVGRVDPAVEVRAVVIHDPLDPPVYGPGDVVLGVGLADPEQIVATAHALGVAGGVALLLKQPVESDDALARAAEEHRLVVIGVTHGASWSRVSAMLASSLGIGENPGGTFVEVDDRTDLFSLANSIAALIDAPVTIEDLNSRVLAFSADQGQADEYRKNAVLGRQVPEDITLSLKRAGLFDRIYASDRPVMVNASDIGLGDELTPRAVMAVRAGSELLGTIWASISEPLTAEREQALTDVAKPAALLMLRSRFLVRGQDRARTETVEKLLAGGIPAREHAARFGRVSGASSVVATMIRSGDAMLGGAEASAATHSEMHRLASAFALHVGAMHPHAVTALLGNTVYAVLPVSPADSPAGPDARGTIVTSMREFISRIGTRSDVIVGIGSAVSDPTQLAASRADADRALRVARARDPRGVNSRVAFIEDVQAAALIDQLGDLIVAENRSLSGPLARITAHDAEGDGKLVATLRAWLDAFGDVAKASGEMYVHPNTLRYRLKRISQVGGIDLDDPETRFELMLQMRVFGT